MISVATRIDFWSATQTAAIKITSIVKSQREINLWASQWARRRLFVVCGNCEHCSVVSRLLWFFIFYLMFDDQLNKQCLSLSSLRSAKTDWNIGFVHFWSGFENGWSRTNEKPKHTETTTKIYQILSESQRIPIQTTRQVLFFLFYFFNQISKYPSV